jgi:Nucleotidyl transferase AbiEii toxin, Type IV TA system
MNVEPLTTTLLDLARTITGADFKLILGGGFGLYLKQLNRQESNLRTLIPGELWPYPRATEDLDIFLPTELVVDLVQMQALRAAINTLGFKPVAEAKFLHFSKPWRDGGRVKIDMLTGPIVGADALAKVKITRPRVRPRGELELHAYLVDEAIDFDQSMLPIPIEGTDSYGEQGSVTVYIPQPSTFLLMKLHAFADRTEDVNRDLGRHHALDVYRIVAMMTDDEYTSVRFNIERYSKVNVIERARQIVAESFSSPTALGIIRLREHSLFTTQMNPEVLIRALADLMRL